MVKLDRREELATLVSKGWVVRKARWANLGNPAPRGSWESVERRATRAPLGMLGCRGSRDSLVHQAHAGCTERGACRECLDVRGFREEMLVTSTLRR